MAASRDPPSFTAQLLKRLEVPEKCGCPFKRIPCDCDRFQRTGDCEHPPRYPPPCRHMLKRNHQTAVVDWVEMLLLFNPQAYEDHTVLSIPSDSLQRNAVVEIMKDRREAGCSLWNDRDRHQTQPKCESMRVGPECHHTPNGQPDKKRAKVAVAVKGGRA